MNEYGEGVVVQHSLLETNGDWHMDRAIEHFKRANCGRFNLLRVIMVDKDLNELRVLQSHFPDVRILICHFHVIKYLKEKRGKPEFGKISTDDATALDAVIPRLVYASSEEVYSRYYKSLEAMCHRIGFEDSSTISHVTGIVPKTCG